MEQPNKRSIQEDGEEIFSKRNKKEVLFNFDTKISDSKDKNYFDRELLEKFKAENAELMEYAQIYFNQPSDKATECILRDFASEPKVQMLFKRIIPEMSLEEDSNKITMSIISLIIMTIIYIDETYGIKTTK